MYAKLVSPFLKQPVTKCLNYPAVYWRFQPIWKICLSLILGMHPTREWRSQTFNRKKVWTCFKVGGGSKGLVQSSFLQKSMYFRSMNGSRTLVRPDISSNRHKVELMSGQTQVLQLFWQFLKALLVIVP